MEIIEKEKVKEVPADYFCDKYGRNQGDLDELIGVLTDKINVS